MPSVSEFCRSVLGISVGVSHYALSVCMHKHKERLVPVVKPSSLVILTLPRTYRQPSETQLQSKANDYIETKLSLLQKNWQ